MSGSTAGERRPVITGYGVFTAFGPGVEALRRGVFAGQPAFAPVTRFDTGPYRSSYAATYGNDARASAPPRQWEVLVGCVRAACAMARLDLPSPATPLLVGTQGDFTGLTRFWRAEAGTGEPPPADALAHSVPGELAHRLGATIGLGHPRIAFVSGCVASSTALIHATQLISAGRADAVVCAGAYVVDEEFFAKFDSGRALATDGRVRPFGVGRTGLLLGDGAAAMVVEAADHAAARDATVLAEVAGWGWSDDAFHQCRPHPQGAGLAAAIKQALRRAKMAPDRVGYVNAHGTGTPIGDVAETAALHEAFGATAGRCVPVSATKSTTGHTLEAAGIVEATICLVALADGVLPPTAGLDPVDPPDPACDLAHIQGEPRPTRTRYALSLNSAFGGINTALLLEAPR